MKSRKREHIQRVTLPVAHDFRHIGHDMWYGFVDNPQER
jgi:hypothetical protein